MNPKSFLVALNNPDLEGLHYVVSCWDILRRVTLEMETTQTLADRKKWALIAIAIGIATGVLLILGLQTKNVLSFWGCFVSLVLFVYHCTMFPRKHPLDSSFLLFRKAMAPLASRLGYPSKKPENWTSEGTLRLTVEELLKEKGHELFLIVRKDGKDSDKTNQSWQEFKWLFSDLRALGLEGKPWKHYVK